MELLNSHRSHKLLLTRRFSLACRSRLIVFNPVCSAAGRKAGQAFRRDLLASGALAASSSVLVIPGPSQASSRSASDLLPLVQHDFQDSQYYITGRLTKDIFASDCIFKDPTTNVKGPEKYSQAVAALFDPRSSRADLLSIKVIDNATIELKWRFEATLNVPTSPKIKAYTGTTLYHISNGLIDRHVETWDISALDAFISVFIPSFGAPAAPPVVTQ